MIEHISLKNFKAGREIDERLATLSVLAGLNSSGKSSLLQAIALLRQSYSFTEKPSTLVLNGDLVHVGHGRDLLSEGADTQGDMITLAFQENGVPYRWVCVSKPEDSELELRNPPGLLPSFLTNKCFQYIQADRVMPRTLYPQATKTENYTGFLGARGEHTADYLARNFDRTSSENRSVSRSTLQIEQSLLKMTSPTSKLLDQVAGWLQYLSPGVRLAAERAEGTDEVLLQYYYVGHARNPRSNDYRPTNVGFGLTYNLPILVACLVAERGSLLLLENPEAHLHPQGQVALGQLLALTAADGVQILVETHSDHLLNGIRLAVKNMLLSPQQVVLHYFTRCLESGESEVQSPTMLPDGKLSNWPSGFFDQWDKSLDALLR